MRNVQADLVLSALIFVALQLLVTCTVLKGKIAMAGAGVALLLFPIVGLSVLAVGASRLARPWSTWARWMYSSPKRIIAFSRFPDPGLPTSQRPGRTGATATGTGTPPRRRPTLPPEPGPRPAGLTVGCWLLVVASLTGFASVGAFGAVLGGVVGPHLVLAGAGRRRSRTVAAVLAAVAALGTSALLVSILVLRSDGPAPDLWLPALATLVCAVTTGTGIGLLYSRPVSAFLQPEPVR